jgi:hypothetical protein
MDELNKITGIGTKIVDIDTYGKVVDVIKMAVVPFGTSLYSQYLGKEGGDEILLVGQSLVEAGMDIKYTDLFRLARAVDRDDDGRETLREDLTPAHLKAVTFALWNFIRSITKVVLTSEDLFGLQELCVLPPFFNEQNIARRQSEKKALFYIQPEN